MKKMILWTGGPRFQEFPENESEGILISPKNIAQKVDLSGESVFMFTCLEPTPGNEKMLNDILPQLIACKTDYYKITALEALAGITVECAGDSEEARDILCYFQESKNIASLAECPTVSVYDYHDGSNWEEIWFDDATMTETEIVYDNETEENLDQHDGSNWSFRGRFNHGRIYPVVEVDYKKVTDTYLLHTWSQYQGSLPSGEIISAEKRQELLAELE